MARPQKKYHYIYKTICIPTSKYYIGMHSTDSLDDGYQGSGVIIKRSIKKYGKDNHITEILEFADNRNNLKIREAEIVNRDLINDPLCLNLYLGGGAADSKIFHGHDQVTKDKISKSLSKPYDEIYGNDSNLQKNKRKIGAKKQWESYTDEQRQSKLLKISEKVKEHWANNEFKVKSYICPHCNKEGKGNAMLLHHFDNCKLITGICRSVSNETKEKIRKTLTGRIVSEETKNKLKGKIPPNKGVKYERLECPFCKKLVASNIANRDHFNNCKYKAI
jgi:hypothetical protein